MAKKTQGTELWFVSSDSAVTKVAELSQVENPSGKKAEIVTTHFDSVVQESLSGLGEGVESTFAVNWDSGDAGHMALEALRVSNAQKTFILGESGSAAAPTVSGGVVTYPVGRHFYSYEARVISVDIGAQVNSKYEGSVTIKKMTDRVHHYTAS